MKITRIDPANMKGFAGQEIRELNDYWNHTQGVLDSRLPFAKSQLWYRAEADGQTLPKMGYLGPESFLTQVMEGQFGDDYSNSVRNQDPKFDQAVSAGFMPAIDGHTVAERIEMEVTPPGHLKPYFVDYYRLIRRFQLSPHLTQSKFLLSVLVVPTDEWLFWHSRVHPAGLTHRKRN